MPQTIEKLIDGSLESQMILPLMRHSDITQKEKQKQETLETF